MTEEVVLMVIQTQDVKTEKGYLLYVILAWSAIVFICAVVLYFLRKRTTFTTTYMHVFGIVVGGGSFRSKGKSEKIFILFLSMFSLLFNTMFTGYLFIEYIKIEGHSRINTAQEFFDSNATVYCLESLAYNIQLIAEAVTYDIITFFGADERIQNRLSTNFEICGKRVSKSRTVLFT